jgi:hypothetical protein
MFSLDRCWTKNKEHKLVNFRAAKMWYVFDNATTFMSTLGLNDRQIEESAASIDRENNLWMQSALRMQKLKKPLLDRWNDFSSMVCNEGLIQSSYSWT